MGYCWLPRPLPLTRVAVIGRGSVLSGDGPPISARGRGGMGGKVSLVMSPFYCGRGCYWFCCDVISMRCELIVCSCYFDFSGFNDATLRIYPGVVGLGDSAC